MVSWTYSYMHKWTISMINPFKIDLGLGHSTLPLFGKPGNYETAIDHRTLFGTWHISILIQKLIVDCYFGERGLHTTTGDIYLYVSGNAIDENLVSLEQGYYGSSRDHYHQSMKMTEEASRLVCR